MFSAVSLEGIINSKKFKKIQNLGNLALFVQEIMCAKIEVIWRWSKNHSIQEGPFTYTIF